MEYEQVLEEHKILYTVKTLGLMGFIGGFGLNPDSFGLVLLLLIFVYLGAEYRDSIKIKKLKELRKKLANY